MQARAVVESGRPNEGTKLGLHALAPTSTPLFRWRRPRDDARRQSHASASIVKPGIVGLFSRDPFFRSIDELEQTQGHAGSPPTGAFLHQSAGYPAEASNARRRPRLHRTVVQHCHCALAADVHGRTRADGSTSLSRTTSVSTAEPSTPETPRPNPTPIPIPRIPNGKGTSLR